MICCCCGSREFESGPILWPELIAAWRLADDEVRYIDRQQGTHCGWCLCNLRTMALATAVMRCYGFTGLFRDFVREPVAQGLRVLEVNEAGNLTPFLEQIPGHVFGSYPAIDMMALPYDESSFDLVVHSDTLEHVEQPVRALSECLRVLKPGGFCAFTIPIIVDRLTASRAGLPPSYHGSPENPADCLVYTEYGADAWKHVIRAGFPECRVLALEYPAALALVGVKSAGPVPAGRGPDAVGGPEALRRAAAELAAAVPPASRLILVDDETLPAGWTGRRDVTPFLEREGEYWGSPPDSETAVEELERLRRGGAEFIAFVWPSFWWLISYAGLRRHLRGRYRCVLENDRLVVFDLREQRAAEGKP
jgi:SAM-dependent methyltransferase